MEILGKIFGSVARVKLLRLFLNNPEGVFDVTDISSRCKISTRVVRKEILLLRSINFLSQRDVLIPAKSGRGKGRRAPGFYINNKFPLEKPLRALLFSADPYSGEEVVNRFRSAGKLKCLIVSGVFIQQPDSRVDILVVGDNLKRGLIDQALRGIEAEIGKELSYGVLETEEFKYRMGIRDRFVRDVLDYPHRIILDRIGI